MTKPFGLAIAREVQMGEDSLDYGYYDDDQQLWVGGEVDANHGFKYCTTGNPFLPGLHQMFDVSGICFD